MAEMNQTQREEELARREALLAQREAQLEKEQAELAAAKAQSAERKKTLLDNNDPNFVNPKEKLYDKFPLTVHHHWSAVCPHSSVSGAGHDPHQLFRAVRWLNPARPTRTGTNKRTKAPAGAGAFCLLQMPVTAGRISG